MTSTTTNELIAEPEALRHAEILLGIGTQPDRKAIAAELRRQHTALEVQAQVAQLNGEIAADLKAERNVLQAEVDRLTTLARGQHIELYNARLRLATSTQVASDLIAEIDHLKAALNRIASWEEGPVVTGSFDNPVDAKTARDALEGKPAPEARAEHDDLPMLNVKDFIALASKDPGAIGTPAYRCVYPTPQAQEAEQ